MIYFFSGNGNSRWVAERIAEITHDHVENMADYIKQGTMPQNSTTVNNDNKLGIIFPIHAWYAPRPVVEFLSRIKCEEKTYRYVVCTCGDDAGKAMNRLHRHFKFDAVWSVRMPNTYIPMFELDSDAVARKKIGEARESLIRIGESINHEQKKWNVFEGAFPYLKTYVINPLFNKFAIGSKGFHLDSGCISCGICCDVCPVDNIVISKGIPLWADRCIHCMACVHHCPQKVIQYKNATAKRGRYSLKKYL